MENIEKNLKALVGYEKQLQNSVARAPFYWDMQLIMCAKCATGIDVHGCAKVVCYRTPNPEFKPKHRAWSQFIAEHGASD